MAYDLIIRGAKVINGTGAPWFIADVGVKDGKICAIGQLTNQNGKEEIDANGNYLSPGFIDTHTHDDVEVIKNQIHPAKLNQGVTTIVTGNCSFSNYPTLNGSNEIIRKHIDTELGDKTKEKNCLRKEHLSSLLGDIRNDEIFDDFNSYKEKLEINGIALNVVSLVGHGPIRLSVMKYQNRYATNEEIKQMCDILELQLQQGAYGLSFGLAYPPSAYAGQDEMIALASVVKKYDGIVASHIRSYSGDLLDSINEFVDVLKKSRAKGLLSHLQVAGNPYWGTMVKAIELIEQARSDGVDISVDMYPYKAGSSSILFLLPPSAQEGGILNLIKKLEDEKTKEEIRIKTEIKGENGWESKIELIGWDNVVISAVTDQQLKFSEGKSIADAAKELNISPFEFTVKAIKSDQGTTCIIMFQQCDQDQITVHKSRLQMIGSDGIPRQSGKPHPRHYGTFARVIGGFAIQDNLMSVEEAVRKCTSLPATRFNLHNRGIIDVGMIADLALFSQDFRDLATYQQPKVHPQGLLALWINGVKVLDNNKFTGKLPGKVIKLE